MSATMFTNKHVIAAMLIAPVVAILAYFAVDNFVSEKPHSAVAGGTYKLIAKSNCRYGSGICTFKNGEMEMDLRLEDMGSQVLLSLRSSQPLSGVRLSLSEAGRQDAEPVALIASSPETWQGRFTLEYDGDEVLRLVASAGGAYYFGETVAAFGHRDNPYDQGGEH